MAFSAALHLLVVLLLATAAVAITAKPPRTEIALELPSGEAGEAIDDAATLVDLEIASLEDAPVDGLPAPEATLPEAIAPLPLVVDESPLAELFAGGGGAGESSDDPPPSVAEALPSQTAAEKPPEDRRPKARAASFFGRSGRARSICFICDNSNSHRGGSFHVVLEELARAVEALDRGQSFFVIFASDAAYPLFHPLPAEGLQPATAENRRRLREWLATVEMCRGGQGIHEAVARAAALKAEVVYLLSDGALGESVVTKLEAADFGGAVVHTFGVQQRVIDPRTGLVDPDRLREQQGRDRHLIAIAAAHRGEFTPVHVPAGREGLERIRPIPRNRARGAVWGLRL